MKLNDTFYNIMKWLCLVVLPCVSTFYSVMAGIWGWPNAQGVSESIAAICALIGGILCISTAEYNKEKTSE